MRYVSAHQRYLSSLILLKNILLGKYVLVGLLVTKALNKVIQ